MFKSKKFIAVIVVAAVMSLTSLWAVDWYVGGGVGFNAMIGVDVPNFYGGELTATGGVYFGKTKSFAVETDMRFIFQGMKGSVHLTVPFVFIGKNYYDYDFQGFNFAFAPEVFAVYNFRKVPVVTPFIGLGIGAQINTMKAESGTDSISMGASFIWSVKMGVKWAIPNTKWDLIGTYKYTMLTNVNGEQDLNSGNPTSKGGLNWLMHEFLGSIGVSYNF